MLHRLENTKIEIKQAIADLGLTELAGKDMELFHYRGGGYFAYRVYVTDENDVKHELFISFLLDSYPSPISNNIYYYLGLDIRKINFQIRRYYKNKLSWRDIKTITSYLY